MAEISPAQPPLNRIAVPSGSILTTDQMDQIKTNVEARNFTGDVTTDLPNGTSIEVGLDGTVTVTYPDGSRHIIAPKDTLILIPASRVEVADVNNLTADEKNQVAQRIRMTNPYLGTDVQITIANDGTASILYPDGGQAMIPGSSLVVERITSQSTSMTGSTTSSEAAVSQTATRPTSETASKPALPKTGETDSPLAQALGALATATGLGFLAKRRKNKEE